MKGNGGGTRFTSADGGNGETRDGYNADPESVDLTGLIRMAKGAYSPSDFFKRKMPQELLSKGIDKIKKYVKGVKGADERREKNFGSGSDVSETSQELRFKPEENIRMHSLPKPPGNGQWHAATEDSLKANNAWKKFRQENPNSNQTPKHFNAPKN